MPLYAKKEAGEEYPAASSSPSGSPKESKSDWLESIGLSVDQFPSLQAHQVFMYVSTSDCELVLY